MKAILTCLLAIALCSAQAQQVFVRNVTPVDYKTIPYPNLLGKTTSSQPQKGKVVLTDGTIVQGKITFFKKKEVFERVKVNTGEEKKEILVDQIKSIELDPIITEGYRPDNNKNVERNFQPGYIVLAGEKVLGKVAQNRDFTDYDFFIYSVAFLPEGSSVASTFKGGQLTEFSQEIGGVTKIWDGYADGYLVRMVDGQFRLSRNPYSKTKNEFFTSVKNQAAKDLSEDATKSALKRSIQDGKNLNESLENAATAGSVVSDVFGSVEINKKEYLIFDTRSGMVTAVNKGNLKEYVQQLNVGCGTSIAASWDKIEDFIRELNTSCK